MGPENSTMEYTKIYKKISKYIQDVQRYAKIYKIPSGGGAARPGPRDAPGPARGAGAGPGWAAPPPLGILYILVRSFSRIKENQRPAGACVPPQCHITRQIIIHATCLHMFSMLCSFETTCFLQIMLFINPIYFNEFKSFLIGMLHGDSDFVCGFDNHNTICVKMLLHDYATAKTNVVAVGCFALVSSSAM